MYLFSLRVCSILLEQVLYVSVYMCFFIYPKYDINMIVGGFLLIVLG